MLKKLSPFIIICMIMLSSCIKDDFIDDRIEPEIRILTNVSIVEKSVEFEFEYMYLNNIGQEEIVDVIWSSSDTSILTIKENTGIANPINEGSVTVSVEYDNGTATYSDSITFEVGIETISVPETRSGTVASTGSYALSGDFTLEQVGEDLILEFAENYEASDALPGLFVYLSNNPSSNAGAHEIGPVTTFSGSHSYTISNTNILTYDYVLYFCKPFNVKVGHGKIQ